MARLKQWAPNTECRAVSVTRQRLGQARRAVLPGEGLEQSGLIIASFSIGTVAIACPTSSKCDGFVTQTRIRQRRLLVGRDRHSAREPA
jgi:hypothetical protein